MPDRNGERQRQQQSGQQGRGESERYGEQGYGDTGDAGRRSGSERSSMENRDWDGSQYREGGNENYGRFGDQSNYGRQSGRSSQGGYERESGMGGYERGTGREGGYGGSYGQGNFGREGGMGNTSSWQGQGNYGRENDWDRRGNFGYGREGGMGQGDYGRDWGQQGPYGYNREGGMSQRGYGFEREGMSGQYGSGRMGQPRMEPWMEHGPETGRGPQGYQRSDERINEDVHERLTRHGQLNATNIQVKVEKGEVTLSGTVDNRQAKRMAEDAIESISGVKEVHNQLRVGRHDQGGMTSESQMGSGHQKEKSSMSQKETR